MRRVLAIIAVFVVGCHQHVERRDFTGDADIWADGAPDSAFDSDLSGDGDTTLDGDAVLDGHVDGDIEGDSSLGDADGDCISDDDEGLGSGVDTDGDGTPDGLDLDSDGDGIDDRRESANVSCDLSQPPEDIDGDGVPNFRDLDSDADGLLDADESLDDCDGDGLAGFRDADSDNDWLDDGEESELHTALCDEDTNDNGLEDWIDLCIGMDPVSGLAWIPGYRSVRVPATGEPVSVELSLDVEAQGHIFLLVDANESMAPVVEGLEEMWFDALFPLTFDATSVGFGVGRFADIPVAGYGADDDLPYEATEPFFSSAADVGRVFDAVEIGHGGDEASSAVLALHAIATGAGVDPWVSPEPECELERALPFCGRQWAQTFVVLLTDSPMHNGPPDGLFDPYDGLALPTWLEATEALRAIDVPVLGLSFGDALVTEQLRQTATATGALTRGGEPAVVEADIESFSTAMATLLDEYFGDHPRDISLTPQPINQCGVGAEELDPTDLIVSIEPLETRPEGAFESIDGEWMRGVSIGSDAIFRLTLSAAALPPAPTEQPRVVNFSMLLVDERGLRLSRAWVVAIVE